MSQTLTTSDLCVARNLLDKEAADALESQERLIKGLTQHIENLKKDLANV